MPNSRLIDGQFAVGDPCWFDLRAADPDSATNFYSQVFGWSFEPGSDTFDDADRYLIATIGTQKVAGLGVLNPQVQRETGWWVHFAAPDIDSMVSQVNDLGGRASDPFDLAGQGRLAIAHDPAGARFGLWDPKTLRTAVQTDTPGAVNWVELTSSDPRAVVGFYELLFAVEAVAVSAKQGEEAQVALNLQRTELGLPRMIGGIRGQSDQDDTSTGWRAYFLVENVAATKNRVVDAGGGVIADLHDASSRPIAIVSDGDGAEFGVVQRGPGSRG